MSEKIKCGICEHVAVGDECKLMTVITNEKGEEVKVCCSHVTEEKK